MKIIKHDLILTEDTTFKESIEVEGYIKGNYNLTVWGDIDAKDIDARDINALNIIAWDINALDITAMNIDALDINANNINARDINAWNIDAGNIDAWDIDAENINARDIDAENINARDIDALNINAWNIICESRIKKSKSSKTICGVYVKNKSKLEIKEQDLVEADK